MKNEARLVKIDLEERLEAVIENIYDNGFDNFKECLGCLIFATDDSNAVDVVVWNTVLRDLYLVDVETILQGKHLSEETVINEVPWPTYKNNIIKNLRINYKSSLDQSITTMVAAVAKRDLLSLKTQAALLSIKFGIEMEEILEGAELNIAIGVLTGHL